MRWRLSNAWATDQCVGGAALMSFKDHDIFLFLFIDLIENSNIQVAFSALRLDKYTNKYHTVLGIKNITTNLCEYFGGGKTLSILDMFLSDIKRCGNIFHPCPFRVRVQRHYRILDSFGGKAKPTNFPNFRDMFI